MISSESTDQIRCRLSRAYYNNNNNNNKNFRLPWERSTKGKKIIIIIIIIQDLYSAMKSEDTEALGGARLRQVE